MCRKKRLTYGRLFQNILCEVPIACIVCIHVFFGFPNFCIYCVLWILIPFINVKPLRRFAFLTFAFLSPYRRLKATISYPDVLHPSKDQPFKTFHVFFIPFFLCLILYLFTFYYFVNLSCIRQQGQIYLTSSTLFLQI